MKVTKRAAHPQASTGSQQPPVVPGQPSSLSPRVLLHYCRACPDEFWTTERANAHDMTVEHYRKQHRNEQVPPSRCSTGTCMMLRQPEELQQERRLYGKSGVRRLKVDSNKLVRALEIAERET